jgi:hypothetical protein
MSRETAGGLPTAARRIAETIKAARALKQAAEAGHEQARAVLEQARREDEAFWRSDPLMDAAEADERARQEAKVGAAIAVRLLSLHVARAPQVPRRSRGRAQRTRRVRTRSGSRGDPSSRSDDEADLAPRRRREAAA